MLNHCLKWDKFVLCGLKYAHRIRVYADNMKPVNIFAVVELSVVLVILCGNLCCAFLHPYRYIRMGYKVGCMHY